MKFKPKFSHLALSLALGLTIGVVSHAEESTMEKAEVMTDKAVNSTKRGYRNVKDKACEMVNGKMECAAKKVGSKAKGLTDDAAAKASELKNKVD